MTQSPFPVILNDMTQISIPIGTVVDVRHGPSYWRGIVAASRPSGITVRYPGAEVPGDNRPARELIDLTRRSVIVR